MVNLMIKKFVKPPFENNNYVVIDEETREAVLIDCSSPDDEIMTYIRNSKAILKYVLLTHAHFDHILGVHYYQEKHNAKVYITTDDIPLLQDMNLWTQGLGFPISQIPQVEKLVSESEVLKLGSISIEVIKTPGHTSGGVCYLIDKYLFSGDTLFQGTYGRTDFPGGDLPTIRKSLKKLSQLPDDIIVYPGHGDSTTIMAEKKWIEELDK